MSDAADFEHTGRVLRDEVRIEAPPETVYRAWSDPEAIASWFVDRMEGRLEEGEEIGWYWAEEDPGTTQRVVLTEPPHRFVTRMELPQGASYLEVTIEQDGGHSVLRLVQSGFGEGPEWDDDCEAMLSGWMIALALLKLFVERYYGRTRREVVVLGDAAFDREDVLRLQRTDDGLARWLARSGEAGDAVGDPVRLVLEDGRTLTGTVLRTTRFETAWSWEEIDGAVELKAFRGASWGSKVGVRVSSWLEDAAEPADLEEWLQGAVARLTDVLGSSG